MDRPSNQIICDGCGVAASPEHIAERLARLELATRFRPVHMDVLFIASSPLPGLLNDFYNLPESREFFDLFLKSVGVFDSPAKAVGEGDQRERDFAKLVEFQRKGYYLTYLSECPIVKDETIAAAITHLSDTLVRRITFNYRPKRIAVLGEELKPLDPILARTRIPSTVFQVMERTGSAIGGSPVLCGEALANLASLESA